MLMVIFVRPTETLARGRACAHGGHGTWLAVSPHTGTLGTCDETVLLQALRTAPGKVVPSRTDTSTCTLQPPTSVRGGSTAGVLAIVHFGSVGRLCGLFERSKAT